jgi:hypothetical protein
MLNDLFSDVKQSKLNKSVNAPQQQEEQPFDEFEYYDEEEGEESEFENLYQTSKKLMNKK